MKFLCTIRPRRSLITACAIAALTLVLHACEKAPPKATQGVPRLSTPATLTTSKSEEKIVAGFPEEDRKAYLSQRANASVAVHVALLAVAFEYQTRGQHQQAARVLRRVVEIFPDFIAGWTELAGELTFFAPAEAEVAMQRARALDPDAVVSRPDVSAPDAGTQIERLLNRQKFREADALVDEFAPSLPDSDWGFLRMAARAKLNNRNPAAAIPYAEKALAIYPRDSETKVVLGIALARVGQAERGEKLLTEMASRFSREANFQAQLAEARIRADRKKEAEQPARRAVELAPDSPEAHQVLGAILTALSRYPEAISELQLSAEMDPNAALTWSTLANAYFGAGQF